MKTQCIHLTDIGCYVYQLTTKKKIQKTKNKATHGSQMKMMTESREWLLILPDVEYPYIPGESQETNQTNLFIFVPKSTSHHFAGHSQFQSAPFFAGGTADTTKDYSRRRAQGVFERLTFSSIFSNPKGHKRYRTVICSMFWTLRP